MVSIAIATQESNDDFMYNINNNNNKIVPDKKKEDETVFSDSIEAMLSTIAKAIEASNQTKDRVINLLLGRTGAGKTTTTHYLSGEKMVLKDIKTVVDVGGGMIETSIKKKIDVENPNAKGGPIGHEKKSETKVISCKSTPGGDLFVDTPGALDDQGPAVDLAHSIGVTKGLHSAKAVRPVIVLDKDTISAIRGPEFGQILDFSSNLIERIQERLGSFSVLFTHYDCSKSSEVENYTTIKENLLDQIKFENAKDQSSNRAILLRFIYTGVATKINFLTVGGQPEGVYVHIVNPLNPDGVQEILSMIKSRPPIENPSQVFKYNISNASKTYIDNECVTLQYKISQSIDVGEYSQAVECLDLIKLLAIKLDLKSLKESYKVSLAGFAKHYNQLSVDVKSYLGGALTPAGSLSIEHLESRLSSIRLIDHLMKNRKDEEKTHFTNDIESYDHVVQCLFQSSNDFERSLNTITSFAVLKDQIVKLHSLSDFNDVFTPSKTNAIKSLTNRINDLLEDTINEIRSHNWEISFNSIQSIQQSNCIQEFIKIQIENEVQTLISSIIKIIEISSEFINQILNREGSLSLHDLGRVRDHWAVIQTSSSFKPLSKLLEIKIEEVYYSPIVDSIAKYTNDILNNLSDPAGLVSSLEKVSILQNLDAKINDRTSNSYRLALRTINDKVKSMKEEICLSLKVTSDQITLQRLFNKLCEIKKLSPMDPHFSEPICMITYLQTIEEIRLFIIGVEDAIVDSFSHNNLPLSNSLSQSLHYLIRPIEFGQNACQEEQQLSVCIENTKNHVKELVSSICNINLEIITNGQWSTLSKQLEKLAIFRYNQMCSTSSTITTIETKIVEHCTTKWEQSSRYISSNDYKSAYDSLNQLQRAKKFDNIKTIISDDKYSEIEETLRRSISNFLSKMRSFIDDGKFNEFRLLQPQLNCLVDLEHYYPSLNTIVYEINNQFREYQNGLLTSFSEKITTRNYSSLKDTFLNLPEDSRVRVDLLTQIINVLRNDEQIIMIFVSQIEQMRVDKDKFSKSLSSFNSGSILSSILPEEHNFERRLKNIEDIIIKQIKLIVDKLKGSVAIHDFYSVDQYSNYIQTLCQQLRYCLSFGNQINDITHQVDSIVRESLDNINEKMFEEKQFFSISAIINGLKKVSNNYTFVLKLQQIENFFFNHIVKRSDSVRKMINDGLIIEARSNVKNIESDIQNISGLIATTQTSTILEELRNFVAEFESLRSNNIASIIKSGNFDSITEKDLDSQTIKNLKDKILECLSSIQRDLSPPRFEQVAENLSWFIDLCSNSVISKKLGNSYQAELDKIQKQILKIAKSSIQKIVDHQKDDNLQKDDIDHYYSIKTHLSKFIKDFNVMDQHLIESMKSYFKTFSEIISRNIDNWKKDVIPFEKNAISDLLSKLNTLRRCDNAISACSILIGNVPTYRIAIDQLKSKIQNRISTLSNDLDSSKYDKSASTILLVYEVYNQLNAHDVVSSNDHPLLIGIGQSHMEMLVNTAKRYWESDDLENYNQTAVRATNFENHMNRIPQINSNTLVKSIVVVAKKHIEEYSGQLHNKDGNELVPSLTKLKEFSDRSPLLKEFVNFNIKVVLDRFIEAHGLGKIQQIGKELEISGRLGKEIISEFTQFTAYKISMWNTRSANLPIEYILEHMTGDEISKEILKSSYDSFCAQYQTIVEREVVKYQDAAKNIVTNAKMIAARIPKKIQSETSRENVISLLAHIFAMWTVSKSGESYVALKFDPTVLIRPHHAQVLAIMRLLGIDTKESWIKSKLGMTGGSPFDNHLIEILTGEGKSITLAVLSTLLSLLKFKVSCVSYSAYLSNRDFTAFEDIFSLFSVTDMITYSTFGELCDSLIKEGGDVRTLTNQFMHSKLKPATKENPTPCSRILLIDEVDVFFGDSFYGQTYNPGTSLQSASIIQLFEYIWKNRKNITISTVSNQNEYKKVMAEFPGHETILSQKIYSMVRDVNSYNIPAYEVDKVNQRIGYRDQDGISFTTTYGSKTAFAYIAEYELGNITEEVMKKNLKLSIVCGHWSFANIPFKFERILGVTGTLKTLTPSLMKIIKDDFKINKYTFTPSIFGKTQLDYKEQDHVLMEENKDLWYRKIAEDILEKTKKERAVIVVFEDEKILIDFETSHYFQQVDKSSKLVESTIDRDTVIKKATTSNQVTLITRSFGRGVDFIVNDDKVIDNGGVHVIQTFLSEEITEEIQIKGRTARQGQKGSYKIILQKPDLVKMGMTSESLDKGIKSEGFYKMIDEKRQELFSLKCEKQKKVVSEANERDNLSNKYLSLICNYSESKKSEISNLLSQFN
ncbi:helicase [Heterostelium album PN500]|uniref:Helicase n=1 Tax=Heterostelium pallidum (strain ATCC 26659 / Pp 5 / PN500) TaxID=670386 RepID=D3BP00_HETP5|nr:helicase [Heterostelium album PN500]EFA77010.1 helicase [Heterostelium album PN500]|eukprot:XP_020429140.1 helicase [Heterostelium album PN500]